MILLVDNHDSFTWNLVQLLAGVGLEVEVRRNDAASVDELLAATPRAVVLGPGPGRPAGAGICLELLERMPESTPLLGVCLGHQALVEHCGGRIRRDPEPVHGRATPVHHVGRGLFSGLPDPFPAGRYHSLCAEPDALPGELELTAWTPDGVAMGVAHRSLPRHGVQFHPDSILTPHGEQLARNFAREVLAADRARP